MGFLFLCVELPLSPAPSLVCGVVARCVLRLTKLKGGRVCSGTKPWPRLVLKKVLFFQFFMRLWGVLGSEKLHLVRLSYFSKGKALGWRGDVFCRAVPRGPKGAEGMGTPQSFPFSSLSSPCMHKPRKGLATAAGTGNLPSGTGSSKQTLHYHCVRYNPDI